MAPKKKKPGLLATSEEIVLGLPCFPTTGVSTSSFSVVEESQMEEDSEDASNPSNDLRVMENRVDFAAAEEDEFADSSASSSFGKQGSDDAEAAPGDLQTLEEKGDLDADEELGFSESSSPSSSTDKQRNDDLVVMVTLDSTMEEIQTTSFEAQTMVNTVQAAGSSLQVTKTQAPAVPAIYPKFAPTIADVDEALRKMGSVALGLVLNAKDFASVPVSKPPDGVDAAAPVIAPPPPTNRSLVSSENGKVNSLVINNLLINTSKDSGSDLHPVNNKSAISKDSGDGVHVSSILSSPSLDYGSGMLGENRSMPPKNVDIIPTTAVIVNIAENAAENVVSGIEMAVNNPVGLVLPGNGTVDKGKGIMPGHGVTVDAPIVEKPAVPTNPTTANPPHYTDSGKVSWAALFEGNKNMDNGGNMSNFSLEGKEFLFSDKGEVFFNKLKIRPCDDQTRSLVGCFADRYPGREAIQKMVDKWGVKCKFSKHPSGWIIFKFESIAMMQMVLAKGPYQAFGKPLILKQMPPFFNYSKKALSVMPLWVQLPDLPIELWDSEYLFYICSVLGKPLYTDKVTLNRELLNFARCMVEIDISKPIPTSIPLHLPGDVCIIQSVFVENKPDFCDTCHHLGHVAGKCNGQGYSPKLYQNKPKPQKNKPTRNFTNTQNNNPPQNKNPPPSTNKNPTHNNNPPPNKNPPQNKNPPPPSNKNPSTKQPASSSKNPAPGSSHSQPSASSNPPPPPPPKKPPSGPYNLRPNTAADRGKMLNASLDPIVEDEEDDDDDYIEQGNSASDTEDWSEMVEEEDISNGITDVDSSQWHTVNRKKTKQKFKHKDLNWPGGRGWRPKKKL